MYGFDAISANNGWSIAAVGIIIVFTGLVVLSFTISQLYKVLDFIENPKKFEFLSFKKSTEKKAKYALISLTGNQKESAKQFSLIINTMEEHFSLPKLLRLAEVTGLGEPYNNLNNLLDSGIVEPDTEGYFTWNKDRFKKLVS